MAQPPSNRARDPIRRTSRAHSAISDSAFTTSSYATPRASPTPTPTPAPAPSVPHPGRRNTAPPAPSDEIPEQETKRAVSKLPSYWTLAPTIPSPFTGTLETSLDAIQEWSRLWAGEYGVQGIVDTLLQKPDTKTNWCNIIRLLFQCRPALSLRSATTSRGDSATASIDAESMQRGRMLTVELLFLVTRTLLPEQIVENRGAMAKLYDRRKHLAIRLVLRYDMLLAWKMTWNGRDHKPHPVVVNCVVPPAGQEAAQAPNPGLDGDDSNDIVMVDAASNPYRRSLLSSIWPTLLLSPPSHPQGFATHGVRERMRHHVTDLDAVLMYTDDEVSRWGDQVLVARTSNAILLWQWMRGNNEVLGEMEVDDWDELDGKADECPWIAD
ncbi:hypothetical protein T440DRAFT_548576 [Plenodomus tracheiphilus IPT5]|uniref:Uncharacterized protein n=1 Tax=Plenodomus tracheiphilus IPT5 TaxID=1408161 RepID=A0A6A7BCH5_9PLEO|nr:hypothetical protein T440DRAFT_548576 [Plenodomus tracheiphilus IPT5]